jgi:dihydroneopterin aldolase
MIATIKIENMEFRASHGCYDLEKKVGNRFMVDVEIDAEVEDAANTDDVSKSINYLTVYELVDEQMHIASNILENVAKRIIDAIYGRFPECLRVTAKVSKLAPPLGGKVDRVSVSMTV